MSALSIPELRRRAQKLGLKFYRSNWRKNTIDNRGGYRVDDVARNLVVDGDQFDCSLEDVARFIERKERA